MAGGIVDLGDFPDEASAWLARAVLDANGIPSEVIHRPRTGMVGPWLLAIRAEHADAAARLLKAAPDGASAS
jgi:hypothetical protein